MAMPAYTLDCQRARHAMQDEEHVEWCVAVQVEARKPSENSSQLQAGPAVSISGAQQRLPSHDDQPLHNICLAQSARCVKAGPTLPVRLEE
eukprot:440071-Rhodomonas_salina.1